MSNVPACGADLAGSCLGAGSPGASWPGQALLGARQGRRLEDRRAWACLGSSFERRADARTLGERREKLPGRPLGHRQAHPGLAQDQARLGAQNIAGEILTASGPRRVGPGR